MANEKTKEEREAHHVRDRGLTTVFHSGREAGPSVRGSPPDSSTDKAPWLGLLEHVPCQLTSVRGLIVARSFTTASRMYRILGQARDENLT